MKVMDLKDGKGLGILLEDKNNPEVLIESGVTVGQVCNHFDKRMHYFGVSENQTRVYM